MLAGQRDKGASGDAPTWGVVMTACEPAALVVTNVRWHLATGAAVVFVYLDDPDDPVAADLSGIHGCRVQLCDDRYWTGHRPRKGRPLSQMRRQTINAGAAQAVCETDWLFHIDADEFIWQDTDLRAELASMTTGDTELNLPVLERLFPEAQGQRHLFDGAFRASADLPEHEAQQAYGAFAGFMKRGQYSHGAGKSGVPVRQGLRLGVHNAMVQGSDRWRRAPKTVSTSARLLHFDGLTPLHWALKFIRYRMTPPDVQSSILQPHRAAQIDWMVARSDTWEAAMAAHAELFALTPERRAQLQTYDLVHDIPFDPQGVLGADLPDVSPKAFDADLIARNPWLEEVMPPVG
ncbi:glycosyltransferase family 2 protein [Tateyamaria sp. SN3-11]|uniref:glycosyltransferase family 2 protein n=1 Tax=Tateyamaria sp. SN3-11 TaxID=3092147 RepID=UPI0039E92A54